MAIPRATTLGTLQSSAQVGADLIRKNFIETVQAWQTPEKIIEVLKGLESVTPSGVTKDLIKAFTSDVIAGVREDAMALGLKEFEVSPETAERIAETVSEVIGIVTDPHGYIGQALIAKGFDAGRELAGGLSWLNQQTLNPTWHLDPNKQIVDSVTAELQGDLLNDLFDALQLNGDFDLLPVPKAPTALTPRPISTPATGGRTPSTPDDKSDDDDGGDASAPYFPESHTPDQDTTGDKGDSGGGGGETPPPADEPPTTSGGSSGGGSNDDDDMTVVLSSYLVPSSQGDGTGYDLVVVEVTTETDENGDTTTTTTRTTRHPDGTSETETEGDDTEEEEETSEDSDDAEGEESDEYTPSDGPRDAWFVEVSEEELAALLEAQRDQFVLRSEADRAEPSPDELAAMAQAMRQFVIDIVSRPSGIEDDGDQPTNEEINDGLRRKAEEFWGGTTPVGGGVGSPAFEDFEPAMQTSRFNPGYDFDML